MQSDRVKTCDDEREQTVIKYEPSMRPVRAVRWDNEAGHRLSQHFSYLARIDPDWPETLKSLTKAMRVLGGCAEKRDVHDDAIRKCLERCCSREQLYRHLVGSQTLRQELRHRIHINQTVDEMLCAVFSRDNRGVLLAELLGLVKEDNPDGFRYYCSGLEREFNPPVCIERSIWTEAAILLITVLRKAPSELKHFMKQPFLDAVIECEEEGDWDSREALLDLVLAIDSSDEKALRRRLQA